MTILRVSYVTMCFPAGAETFACTDVRVLRSLGVDVRVHAMRRAAAAAGALLEERGLADLPVSSSTVRGAFQGAAFALSHPAALWRLVPCVLRTTWRHPRLLATSLWLLPRTFRIVQQLIDERPDVVHLFWGHYPSLVGLLVRELLPGVTVTMFLGAYDLTYRYGPSADMARAATIVFTHARENVTDILGLDVDPGRLCLVHRGVDVTQFGASQTKLARRVACAARLCAEKHVDDVLRVCAGLGERGIDVTAAIMGDGPDRARLETMSASLGLADRVRFLGHVPHHVVRDELATAAFFVLMSREPTERLTNAVKEAMASGCLCVVASSPGLEELITDGREGFVVDAGDVATAVRRIAWALDHESESRAIRDAAAARIRSDFDVRAAMAAYRRGWLTALARADRFPAVRGPMAFPAHAVINEEDA